MTDEEVLRRAWHLIDHPDKWCKGMLKLYGLKGPQFCAVGAINEATLPEDRKPWENSEAELAMRREQRFRLVENLNRCAAKLYPKTTHRKSPQSPIVQVNDELGWEGVKAVYKCAMEEKA
jgi:hypothetical protein